MKKALLIGWKDLRLAFRDRAALMLMLAAPFLLTLGMGLVTGRFSGSSGNIQSIPVVVINEDTGQLGEALTDLLISEDLAEILDAEASTDETAARQQLEADELAAVVIIPAGFSDSIIPAGPGAPVADIVQIELLANPARPVTSGVVSSIVEGFLDRVETGVVGGQVAVAQLLTRGLASPDELAALGQELGTQAVAQQENALIRLVEQQSGVGSVDEEEFDVLAILAPGLAVMFLMYTVSYGGRSLLVEQGTGTLPRILTTPTHASQVLGGKVSGIYLTGLAQLLILIVGTSLLFQLNWGDPVAVLVLILATVFGASGWGILLAAVARNPNQVSSIGTALMLLFGILGGTFISAALFPEWLQALRLLTPNAWALDGLTALALGGNVSDILTSVAALIAMGAVLFVVAVLLFRRRGGLTAR